VKVRFAALAVIAGVLSPLAGALAPLPAARAQTNGPLGGLEQQSLDEELAALGLRIDPAPQGKVVGAVHVVNQEVFSRHDWYFQLLNIFHRTTRPYILARELLLQPGDPYNQLLVEESTRNLQSPQTLTLATGRPFTGPDLSSVVLIVPVVSPRPGTVDLLVVTRDLWSLRFNTNFEFQENTLSFLATSLSENNLFGWRKYLAVNFVMDQGSFQVGPTYFDPNILGSRLTLLASAYALYGRESRDYEGNVETLSLRYPLYALSRHWGGGVEVVHQDAVIRRFQGNNLRIEDVPETPIAEMIPYAYRRKIAAVDTTVVRQMGIDVIQRVTFGHHFDSRRSEVLPDFPYDAATAALFLHDFAPATEQRSELFLRYELFTPRYVVIRNLDTFDLRENLRLGPSLLVQAGIGLPELGADFQYVPLSGALSWAEAPGGGYGSIAVAGGARLKDGQFIDQVIGAKLFLAGPILGRFARLVAAGELDAVHNDTTGTIYLLGGSTGLRGYEIGDLQGTVQWVGHVELRSLPVAVFSQRVGGLLFYDVGDAANSFSQLTAFHDFGLGLRWLIPQLNPTVIRVDWAIATQSTTDLMPPGLTRAGFPGRVSAGFLQVF
jgi:hypothetical protein